MSLIRMVLLFGCLVGATLLAPRVDGGDPWIEMYLAYVSLAAGLALVREWQVWRREMKKSDSGTVPGSANRSE